MADTAALGETAISKIHSALDLLHGAVARIDTVQQQMRAQFDAQAEAIQESAPSRSSPSGWTPWSRTCRVLPLAQRRIAI